MAGKSPNAEFLLRHVQSAIRVAGIGDSYTACQEFEGGAGWAVGTNFGASGQIIVLCDDTVALEQVIAELRSQGHTVEDAGIENTVMITPKSV